jgi:fructose-1,6-bisphosphatase II / sedoheptulose-1,7-bisphosphatase
MVRAKHMSSIDVHPTLLLERILSIEIVRVTERAAVCAARMRGRGDEIGADKMAVDAMRRELNRLPIDGTVVIGEGERDEAPMLYIGERIGTRKGPRVDIAVDPLEGTTLCAKNMPGAIATIAIADSGTLLHAPDVYMEKIALGPGYPKGVVDLDAPVGDNILALANVKGVKPADVNVLVLDRPRHSELIASARKSGAGVSLITDGDIAGVIDTVEPEATGVDMYVGIGGAPEVSPCLFGSRDCIKWAWHLALTTQEMHRPQVAVERPASQAVAGSALLRRGYARIVSRTLQQPDRLDGELPTYLHLSYSYAY